MPEDGTVNKRCQEVRHVIPAHRDWSNSRGARAAGRAFNRLACAGKTLRHALNILAAVVPDWLRARVAPDRYECDGL